MAETRQTRPHRLEHLDRDRGYRWADEADPVVGELTRLITGSGLALAAVAAIVARNQVLSQDRVTAQTIGNWMNGKTLSPQNRKVDAVLRALGYRRIIQ